MVKHSEKLDAVFSALSDPTRRAIIERLVSRPATVGDLAAGFAISQPGISKHIKVLEHSGLLIRTISGREHHCRLSPKAMKSASDWMTTQQRFWNATLDKLDQLLTSTERKKRS